MKIFRLPDLGEGLAEAEIREWYVKVGEVVKVDQPLVSMETAKAVVEVPSPYAGKISELHGKPNEIIQTGAPLVSFSDQEGLAEKQTKNSVVGALEESSAKWNEDEVVIGSTNVKTAALKAMPAARVLAQQMAVDLILVTPTGPQGLITANDVKKYLEQKSKGSASLLGQTQALHGVRRIMAQAMFQSRQEIVPVTIIEDADITDVPSDTDISVCILQAMVAGVKAEPALNAWFDGKTLERKLFTEVNIGLATDTEEGLFVPVIKHAEARSQEDLRMQIDAYKAAVRSRTLTSAEMTGATMTLSNFGTIAGRYATPIIVPPTVAILGCGRSREVVLPRDGKIVIGRLMPLSLTFDHRAITGGEATRFLAAVINYLESPDRK